MEDSPFDLWTKYWDAGWRGLFPLPFGKKSPPPGGRTGRDGVDATYADLYSESQDLGRFNLGLRLPPSIIGIDVDAYADKVGAQTLKGLTDLYGQLPPTWRCSSRLDGISGIYLYAIPFGAETLDGWQDIDVIQWHHRYVVAPPSVHPTGAVYTWYRPDGEPSGVPSLHDLQRVLLPVVWLEHMQKDAGGVAKMELDRGQARTIIDQMPTGDPCRHVQAAAGAAIGLGAVHELFRPAILKVVGLGRDGCPGAAAALVGLHRAFLAEKTYGPGGISAGVAEGEWHRLLDGAIAAVANKPQGSMCVDRQLDWINEVQGVDELPWEPIPAIDWKKLWEDETVEEWFCEPLLAKRRLVALYSPPKVGKSLLMLEMAAAIATGRPMFGYSDPPEATSVLYVDFENDPRGDIRTRLQAMGYGADDLALLHLLSFPTLPALDSERGSIELMRNLAHHQAEVLIIDTVSRAIAGEENDNDTWLNFYRHTGLKLKQAGIAMIRLDHSGKDVFRGQRGGSAKSGDVDSVWRLSQIDDGSFQLECEAKRFQILETSLTLTREVSPWLRHTINPFAIDDSWKRKISAALIDLDAHGIDSELGARKAYEALQKLGKGHSARSVKDAQSRRRVGNQAEMG